MVDFVNLLNKRIEDADRRVALKKESHAEFVRKAETIRREIELDQAGLAELKSLYQEYTGASSSEEANTSVPATAYSAPRSGSSVPVEDFHRRRLRGTKSKVMEIIYSLQGTKFTASEMMEMVLKDERYRNVRKGSVENAMYELLKAKFVEVTNDDKPYVYRQSLRYVASSPEYRHSEHEEIGPPVPSGTLVGL